ncbi:MAG: recombinase family protein [Ruminococcus sp.]
MRREAKGEECKREVKQTWSIITVSEILQNDFYIGTRYVRASTGVRR